MSQTRNVYVAEWTDGRTLKFVSDSRKDAGDAMRSLNCGKIKSIRKVDTMEIEE